METQELTDNCIPQNYPFETEIAANSNTIVKTIGKEFDPDEAELVETAHGGLESDMYSDPIFRARAYETFALQFNFIRFTQE